MSRMLRLLFILFAAPLTAQNISELVLTATDLYFDGKTSEALNMIERAESPDSPYWSARLLHLKGRILVRLGDEDAAEDLFTEMDRLCVEEVTPEVSALSLRSEARSRLMLIRGIPYTIRNAGKTERIARDALEIEPDNALALLVLAQGKINAPGIFGGDVDFGISCLERVLENTTPESGELFTAYISLSEAWEKKKDYARATRYAETALSIYPGNPEAVEWLKHVRSKRL